MKSIDSTEKAIQEYAATLGYWPSSAKWDNYARRNGNFSRAWLYKHTNMTWNQYRVKFGYPPHYRTFSKEECIAAIQQAASELSHWTMKMYEEWRDGNADIPSGNQIKLLFGTWNNAVVGAGLTPNSRGRTVKT